MEFSCMKQSASATVLMFSVTVFVFLNSARAVIKLPENVSVPAILVFGDSIVDTGNNNNLKTLIKCNFPPYGRDFMGGMPTGRFCNGKVPSDLIAEELGIKKIVPAYLDPTLQPQDLLTGVTFASGGTGYDPLTPQLASVISMSDQLKYFKEYRGKLKAIVGKERSNFIIGNSICLVVAGSDDIANTYFTLRARKQYDVPSYTDLMANSASHFVQELYGMGARRIGVFSAPPIGCVPSQRTLAGGIQRECAENYNEAAKLFNSKISAKLHSLNSQLPNSRIVYVDVYTPLLDLFLNPQKFGFQIGNKGCCGTGNIEVVVLCNELNPYTCTDVSKYVFWDSYHPTEGAYKAILPKILQKYANKFF